jgi:predicted homoserine dehydrogenase-like protein
VRRCFHEYGIVTDPSGEYAAMYKPSHLIGLELGISVASVALRREPTGCATGWRGDCAATAKRALKAGEMLDGEGGCTVWGKLLAARDSSARRALPIGLAHKVKLKRDIAEGARSRGTTWTTTRRRRRCSFGARWSGHSAWPSDAAANPWNTDEHG